jgi:hypothetical protein
MKRWRRASELLDIAAELDRVIRPPRSDNPNRKYRRVDVKRKQGRQVPVPKVP